MLLSQAERRLGLAERLAAVIPDERDASRVTHRLPDILRARIVRRALSAVFGGAISKDTVSRVWRKVKGDWDAWNAGSLAEVPIIRLILDGTVVRVRLDRKATTIVLLVVLGVREDGQKVLMAVKNMGGETSAAWRAVLDDLVKRGLRSQSF